MSSGECSAFPSRSRICLSKYDGLAARYRADLYIRNSIDSNNLTSKQLSRSTMDHPMKLRTSSVTFVIGTLLEMDGIRKHENQQERYTIRIISRLACSILMNYFPFLFARETARVRDFIKRPRETSSIILAARAEVPAFRDRNSIARAWREFITVNSFFLVSTKPDTISDVALQIAGAASRRIATPRVSLNEIFTLSAMVIQAGLHYFRRSTHAREREFAPVNSIRYICAYIFASSIFLLP